MFLFNEPPYTCHDCHQGAAAYIIGAQELVSDGKREGTPGHGAEPRPRKGAIVARAVDGAGKLSPGSAAVARLPVSALATMPWTGVVKWMRDLDIDDSVIQVVQNDRVPGSQIAVMTLAELMEDMGLSKLQVHFDVHNTFACASKQVGARRYRNGRTYKLSLTRMRSRARTHTHTCRPSVL